MIHFDPLRTPQVGAFYVKETSVEFFCFDFTSVLVKLVAFNFSCCIGVMSDSANVMIGQKGGVIALLRKEILKF